MTALPTVDPMDLVRDAHATLRHALVNHSAGGDHYLVEAVATAVAELDLLVRADRRQLSVSETQAMQAFPC